MNRTSEGRKEEGGCFTAPSLTLSGFKIYAVADVLRVWLFAHSQKKRLLAHVSQAGAEFNPWKKNQVSFFSSSSSLSRQHTLLLFHRCFIKHTLFLPPLSFFRFIILYIYRFLRLDPKSYVLSILHPSFETFRQAHSPTSKSNPSTSSRAWIESTSSTSSPWIMYSLPLTLYVSFNDIGALCLHQACCCWSNV